MSDSNKWNDDSFRKSWLGRVLRGEEKIEFDTTERPEYPKFAETAHMTEDGNIDVRRSWYEPDGGKAIGNTILKDPNSDEYKEVLIRHPDLAPHKPSTYEEYHDGRWQLTRGDKIIAAGNIGHGPDQESETEKRRAAG